MTQEQLAALHSRFTTLISQLEEAVSHYHELINLAEDTLKELREESRERSEDVPRIRVRRWIRYW